MGGLKKHCQSILFSDFPGVDLFSCSHTHTHAHTQIRPCVFWNSGRGCILCHVERGILACAICIRQMLVFAFG